MAKNVLQSADTVSMMNILQRRVAVTLFVALGIAGVMADPCAAQTIQANPQAQTALTPAVGLLPPTPPIAPLPSTIAGTGETPGLNQTVAREKLSPPVGRRLPGMPGGPPLYMPMGAGDPTAAYMRPTVVGPLSCNLILDPACF